MGVTHPCKIDPFLNFLDSEQKVLLPSMEIVSVFIIIKFYESKVSRKLCFEEFLQACRNEMGYKDKSKSSSI